MAFPALYKDLAVSPDTDDFFIETLEFQHPVFTSPIRITSQPKAYTLTLEATASVDPSTAVNFQTCPFEIRRPKKGDRGFQQVTIGLPNIDRIISSEIDRARASGGALTCYWRTYAFTQQTAPILDPPPRFEIKSGNITPFEISLQANFFEFLNDKFPGKVYTSSFAPGLTR